MPKFTWIIAGTISGALLIVLIFGSVRSQSVKNQRLERELALARAALEKGFAEMSALSNKLDEANAAITKLSEENKNVVQTQQSLEDEMRKALESKEVTISELRGKLTVNILDRILFDSGEAELKAEGQRILEKIAGVLAQHTNRQVHIIGHTDDVPIHREIRQQLGVIHRPRHCGGAFSAGTRRRGPTPARRTRLRTVSSHRPEHHSRRTREESAHRSGDSSFRTGDTRTEAGARVT